MQILLNYIVILSLSLFVFSYDSVSQTVSELSSGPTIDEDSEEYWNNHRYIDTTANGQLNGAFESYYENGQLYSKQTFKDGKEDGASESYHENGQLSWKGTYKNGKSNGPFEMYYENGQLRVKGTYKDGEPSSDFEEYNEDGTIRD